MRKMKKISRISEFKNLALAALLIAGAAFISCSSDDDIIGQPTAPKTYTLTIQATKGDDATTRALSLSGKTLNATWKEGETVDVYKVTEENNVNVYASVGTLTAQADGATATLSGNLTGTFEKNDNLVLFFHGGVLDYRGQTGTLEDISSKYDYATADTEVSKVDGSNITVVDAGTQNEPIPFDNQQVIVKFTLKDNTGNPISMKSLRLHDENGKIFDISDFLNESDHMGDIVVTRSTAGSEFYVAIKTEEDYVEPNLVPSSLNLTLTATDDTDIYTYTKSGVQFECGKYYEITVKMTKSVLIIENPAVGQVIGSNGKNYASVGDMPSGVNAVAKIFYLDGGNGLALALTDEGYINWEAANTAIAAHTPAFTGGTWKIATKDEWNNMISGAGGYTALRDAFSSVGGTNLKASGNNDYYWSSTEHSVDYMESYSFYVNTWANGLKSLGNHVRACLAFSYTQPAIGHALSASAVGEIIGSNGLAYDVADKDNLPSGVTVAARIFYVNGGNGLALALADEGYINWEAANTAIAAHAPAFTGGTWKIATKDEWNNMISGAGGYTALRDAFESVGGTNLKASGNNDYYWSSTEHSVDYMESYSFYVNTWANGLKSHGNHVRACLAF